MGFNGSPLRKPALSDDKLKATLETILGASSRTWSVGAEGDGTDMLHGDVAQYGSFPPPRHGEHQVIRVNWRHAHEFIRALMEDGPGIVLELLYLRAVVREYGPKDAPPVDAAKPDKQKRPA